jgi:hypothetical protein
MSDSPERSNDAANSASLRSSPPVATIMFKSSNCAISGSISAKAVPKQLRGAMR